MKYYDGPAFYRKNDLVKPEDKFKKHSNKESGNASRSRYFHPTYIPKVIGQKIITVEPDYRRLATELRKSPSDYLLFDDDEKDAIDLTNGLENSFKEETSEETSSEQADMIKKELVSNDGVAPGEKDETVFSNDETEKSSQLKVETFYPKKNLDDNQENAPKENNETSPGEKDETVFSNDETEKSPQLKVETFYPKKNFDNNQENAPKENNETSPGEKDVRISEFVENKKDPKTFCKNDGTTGETAVIEEINENKDASENAAIDKNPLEKSIVNASNQEEQSTEKMTEEIGYRLPPLSLLPEPIEENDPQSDEWVLNQAETLNETLKAFKVEASVSNWTVGPTVTQFELSLGRGVKVNKITNLNDDLKLALAAKDIRIEAPIPGRSTVGIEIPNKKSRPVLLSEVLGSDEFQTAKSPLTTALGVDLFGRACVTDIQKMPHGLIAGATGSGKSVFINSMLMSILYKAKPSEVKLLLIDPKAVEMAPYQGLPHLLSPVVSDPQAATEALKWVVEEMEERYQKLAALGARNLEGYNRKLEEKGHYAGKLPYIVIVIDELADLMMASSSEVQEYIARITQKARAAGIHLIVATQRPSVDVVTGLIKNNIPTRIAFMVSSSTDSRTILDCSGAERLLGRGDMLYLGNGSSQPLRLQGTYIEDEIDDVCDFIRKQAKPHYAFNPETLKKKAIVAENQDELMPRVLDYIVNEETISTSKLQRIFSIGYNRAASIIDDLESKGYISQARGAKPRTVHLTQEALNNMRF